VAQSNIFMSYPWVALLNQMSTSGLAAEAQRLRFSYKRLLATQRLSHADMFASRVKSERSVVHLLRGLVGLFLTFFQFRSKLGSQVYIFHDSRLLPYCSAVDPENCILLGSHVERQNASANGYRFLWGFPITSAVNVLIYWRSKVIFELQIYIWQLLLGRLDKLIILTYEDTQQIGEFFVTLYRLFPKKILLVCVQHGYYVQTSSRVIVDGDRSPVNFVIDGAQVACFNNRRSKFKEIGLPYCSFWQTPSIREVVYVGCGDSGKLPDGRDPLEQLLFYFKDLDESIQDATELLTVYRPHPSELDGGIRPGFFRQFFDRYDRSKKEELLSGSRKIFIGAYSTLLYEAGVAGHVVIYVDPCINHIQPLFLRHLDVKLGNVSAVSEYVKRIIVSDAVSVSLLYPSVGLISNPVGKFQNALSELGCKLSASV